MSGIRNAVSKRHEDANNICAATLERIYILAAPQKGLANRTIAWLTFTKKLFEENELKEAFAISSVNGQVDPDAQLVIENVVEYCRSFGCPGESSQSSMFATCSHDSTRVLLAGRFLSTVSCGHVTNLFQPYDILSNSK